MREKHFIWLFLFLLMAKINFSQQVTSDVVPLYFGSGGYFTEITVQKEAAKGNIFLNTDKWLKANITLLDSSKLENVFARYNMKTKKLEIKVKPEDSTIYTLYYTQLAYAKLGDFYIENCLHYKIKYPEDLQKCDIVIPLVKGKKLSLFKVVDLDVIYANYNEALSAGKRYDTYVQKASYFIIKNDKYYDYTLSRLNALLIMQDKKDQIKQFVKQNKLSYKNEQDVVKIFKYYNSL